jgi:SAM-dependent methyltransferase
LKSKTPTGNALEVPANIPCGAEQQKLVDAHFRSHAVQWKEVYEEVTVEGAIYRERLAIVLDWVDSLRMPAGEQVLEIGCGAGACTVALAQRGYIVEAIDSVANMLDCTRQRATDAGLSASVSTGLGDAHSLAFPKNNFGLVLAIGVIPYLHTPKAALEEMVRVLKPGGFLLVTAGNRWRLNHALDPWVCPALQPAKAALGGLLRRFRKPGPEPDMPPLRYDSLRQFEDWLSLVGLAKIKAKTVGFPPLTFRYRQVFGKRTSIKLNRWLQWLVDHNVPAIRSSGMDYIVLARKK